MRNHDLNTSYSRYPAMELYYSWTENCTGFWTDDMRNTHCISTLETKYSSMALCLLFEVFSPLILQSSKTVTINVRLIINSYVVRQLTYHSKVHEYRQCVTYDFILCLLKLLYGELYNRHMKRNHFLVPSTLLFVLRF